MKTLSKETKNNCPEDGLKCPHNKVTKNRTLLNSSPYFMFNFTWENPRPMLEEVYKVMYMIPNKFENKMIFYMEEEK